MVALNARGLSLDRLSSFLAIADAGGLARAAPGDAVRQSQLSRQLKDLEFALGRPLFVRKARGLELTSAGVELSRVVRSLGQGLSDVAAAEQGAVEVSLAAGDSVLQWVLLPGLAKLEKALQGVELDVGAAGADEAAQAVLDHRVDLALMRESPVMAALKTLRLGRVEYAVFHRAGAPKLPLAIPTTERGLWPALSLLGPVGLRCQTFPQVAQAVRSGSYAGVVPTFARSALPASEFRQVRLPALDRVATPLLLAWRPRTLELRPAVKRLRDALALLVRPSLSPAF
jgi:DNA-binding transcriptional LysR family regulator